MSEEIKFEHLSCPNHFGIETECCKQLAESKALVEKLVEALAGFSGAFSLAANDGIAITNELLYAHKKAEEVLSLVRKK